MAGPLLALTLGYDKVAVGCLLALFALPQVILALPAGRWADSKGVRIPVRASVVLAVMGYVISAVWPIYPALCLTAVTSGASIAAATIALQRHVGRAARTSAELKHAFGWLSMAPALSNFVGPLVAGLVIDHVGYRAAFTALAALPAFGWLWIRSTPESVSEAPPGTVRETPWNLWRQRAFRDLLVLNWLAAACFDVHGFVVPVLGHERGLSASAIGAILGSFAIAAAMVRIAMPALASHVREWKIIATALGTAAFFFFLYPFVRSPVAMAFCSAAIGLSVGSVQPTVMGLLHQITPPHRHGEALAMRLLLINASSVAMPVVFGTTGGVIGVSSLFWLMSIAVGIGSRLSLALRGIKLTSGH